MEPASSTGGSGERPVSTDDRGMTGGRVAVLVAGILVGVLALAVLAAGAAVLAFNHTERDSAGFFATANEPDATEGYAIVSEDLDIGTDGPDWLFEEGRLATIRVRGSCREPGSELFIGIAPTADVKSYLAGARYDTVTDLDFDPFRVTYRPSKGVRGRAGLKARASGVLRRPGRGRRASSGTSRRATGPSSS
jgi:hypothetical protein